MIADVAAWLLLLGGSFFCLVGAVGLIRLPDFYSRSHATGVLDTLGTALIILGLAVQGGFSLVTFKLLLILAFLWITGPTALHALAQAAVRGGVQPTLGERSQGESASKR